MENIENNRNIESNLKTLKKHIDDFKYKYPKMTRGLVESHVYFSQDPIKNN